MSATQVPVLIVGGGPAGLATALFLRRHNIACLLAERHASTSPLPRATGVHARSMELFREAGIERQVRDAGLALVATEQKGEQASISRVILRARSLSHLDEAKVMEVGEPFSRDLSPCEPVWCGQDLLEPELLTAAVAGGADIRLATEADSITVTGEGVTADLHDRETGAVTSVAAQYLVAADGVYSGIRSGLGVERSGAGVLDYMVSVQFRADLSSVIGDRRFILAFVVNEGVNGVAVCLDGKERWMVWTAVADQEDQASYDEKRCIALARAAIGRDDVPLSITGMFPWETTHLIADTFRQRRCFLVGDAAHTHPPHGGFGANAGVQDAHNLAWKLAAVLSGQAGPGLLDTYEAERRPVGQATADQALIRERQRQSAAGDPRFRDFPVVIVGYRYSSAAIQDGTAGGLSHDDALPPSLELRGAPGSRLPHVWLSRDGAQRSSLDLCAGRLTLLIPSPGTEWREAAAKADPDGLLTVAESGTDFDDPDGALAAACDLGPAGALLVRPDQFVAWRLGGPGAAAEQPAAEQLAAAVSAILCRTPAPVS